MEAPSNTCIPIEAASQGKRCKSADRLSGLPDELLIMVVSRLRLNEAVKTSLLSRRWRDMWMYTNGTLNFHYEEEFSFFEDLIHTFDLCFENVVDDEGLLLVKRSEFTKLVNHVLSLHQGPTIEEFHLFVKSRGTVGEEYIEKWVEFALGKRVKRLKLDFSFKDHSKHGYFSITRPLLRKYVLNLNSVTVLSLNNVEVTAEVIDYVLLKCCSLEELHVEHSGSLLMLKVPGPLPRLKCLKIIGCDHLNWMEIHAINIVSFAYHGPVIPVSFETAPRLVNTSLRGRYASYFVHNIGKYTSYIKSVESLVLELKSTRSYLSDGVVPELPVLENLRVLELDLRNIAVQNYYKICAAFLKKCPQLTKLILSVSSIYISDQSKGCWTNGSSECLHRQLKVIEILGIYEDQAEVIYPILSGLPSLDQVIFRPFFYWKYKQLIISDMSYKLEMIHPKVKLIRLP